MKLDELTLKLLDECGKCRPRHARMREEEREPDFFAEVKPYADQVHERIAEWQNRSKEWIRQDRPKHVREAQIENAADMMTQFVVQSFYPKTGKKRFYDSIQSVEYLLKTMMTAMKEGADGAKQAKDHQ
ncbi:YppE family protein [Bhargavaea massiliensis]|uniref:YppE family protein n=1 Tax=Bhargavaea massiliensis TaxID=2697500 RepID=UPI001BD06C0E|nr:YppE family protein [Bhargavaea massiliensis]